jgi:hypothetical protein
VVMGEFADVKQNRVIRLLNWLNGRDGFEVWNGGNHQWVLNHETWTRPFPVPFKHNVVKKGIMVALIKQILATGNYTKEELEKQLYNRPA